MAALWRAPAGLHVASARLPDEGELPSFDGATGWLNSQPLTPAALRHEPVLAQALHQHDPGPRDAGGIPPGGGRLGGEPVTGQ